MHIEEQLYTLNGVIYCKGRNHFTTEYFKPDIDSESRDVFYYYDGMLNNPNIKIKY